MLLARSIQQDAIVEPVALDLMKQHLRVDSSFVDDDALISAYITAARQFAEKYTHRAFFTQRWRLTLDHFPTYVTNTTINPANKRDYYYYAGAWANLSIALPVPRCQSIDSISYLDLSQTRQTLLPAAYYADMNSEPARIVPTPGLFWPLSTVYLPGSVQVDYTTASFTQQATETFTVAANGQYAPLQSPVTGVISLLDSTNTAVPYTLTDGVLSVSTALAGQTLTVSYYFGTIPQSIVAAILLLAAHWYEHRESVSDITVREMPFAVSALLDLYTFNVLSYQDVV